VQFPKVITSDRVAQSSSSAWQDFISDPGKFSIKMPSTPAEYTIPPYPGMSNGRMFFQVRLEDSGNMEIYAVAFVDLTQDLRSLEASTIELSRCAGARLQSQPSIGNQSNTIQQEIVLGNYRGLEMKAQTTTGGLQVVRCYSAGQRMYMLMAMSEPFSIPGFSPISSETSLKLNDRPPEIDGFFNSFQILE
jgi:hypothetical protein